MLHWIIYWFENICYMYFHFISFLSSDYVFYFSLSFHFLSLFAVLITLRLSHNTLQFISIPILFCLFHLCIEQNFGLFNLFCLYNIMTTSLLFVCFSHSFNISLCLRIILTISKFEMSLIDLCCISHTHFYHLHYS